MKKSIGLKKTKTAIFISGRGSNLENLIKFSKKKNTPISIELIISNTKKAKGLKYARQFNILSKILNFNNKNYEKKLIALLDKKKIKFICLAGFMKILSKNFINMFKGKIINIHPSLLPKYKGLNTHQKAITNKDEFSGCTVHYVSSKIDSGKIILQKKVKINKLDTYQKLEKKILEQEYKIYPKAIMKIFN